MQLDSNGADGENKEGPRSAFGPSSDVDPRAEAYGFGGGSGGDDDDDEGWEEPERELGDDGDLDEEDEGSFNADDDWGGDDDEEDADDIGKEDGNDPSKLASESNDLEDANANDGLDRGRGSASMPPPLDFRKLTSELDSSEEKYDVKESKEPYDAIDMHQNIERDVQTALSQQKTKRMGAKSSDNLLNGNSLETSLFIDQEHKGEEDVFGSEDVLELGVSPAAEGALSDPAADVVDEYFINIPEEEELTEEAALEYSRMLEQMQEILNAGRVAGEKKGRDEDYDDEAFEDDFDEGLFVAGGNDADEKLGNDVLSENNVLSDVRDADAAPKISWLSGMAKEIRKDKACPEDDKDSRDTTMTEGLDGRPMTRFRTYRRSSHAGVGLANKNSADKHHDKNKGGDVKVPGGDMTVYGLPLPLSNSTAEELHITADDSPSQKMEAIRVYLEGKLGEEIFVKAYRFLKNIEEEDDDEDALLNSMEAIVGTEGLKYLDVLFQLITIEERFEG